MIVLGLHGGVTIGQHEPSATLIVDGKVVAFCEEERYLRIKSCYGYLPQKSIDACLKIGNINFAEIDLIVTPGSTYEDFPARWTNYLTHLYGSCPKVKSIHHQLAHLSATFYGSGLENALCISLDASGDGLAGAYAIGDRKSNLELKGQIPTSNSLGYFYTIMTYYLGFMDGDEYKVMGLAPYGKPNINLDDIINTSNDGWEFNWSFVRSNPAPRSPFEPQYSEVIEKVLKMPPRKPNDDMTQFYKDVAASTQKKMEDCLISYLRYLKSKHPDIKNLCYAGGVALNCSANNLLLQEGFDNVYVSPISSDRGLSLGCAYYGSIISGDNPQPLNHVYLGDEYSSHEIKNELDANNINYNVVDNVALEAAKLLDQEKIIGWHQGRSEGGARALGNRSIIASCKDTHMRDKVNAKIKYREEFRPFAPAILDENLNEYFKSHGNDDFPYMTFTLEAQNGINNKIPAVVHVDNTSRVQTVKPSSNSIYYQTIKEYNNLSGTPVIMNTSFNLKGQPIVETPRDALMTFYGCGMDALFIGNFLIEK